MDPAEFLVAPELPDDWDWEKASDSFEAVAPRMPQNIATSDCDPAEAEEGNNSGLSSLNRSVFDLSVFDESDVSDD